jgi:hypothetical protein
MPQCVRDVLTASPRLGVLCVASSPSAAVVDRDRFGNGVVGVLQAQSRYVVAPRWASRRSEARE